MKHCEQYEVELSAMLDGESDPATAIGLMDHVCQCSSCREFYRELRSFQIVVDDLSPVESTRFVPGASRESGYAMPRRKWSGWFDFAPRWAWGAAVIVIVAIGLWAAGGGLSTEPSGVDFSNGKVTIELEGGEASVDDERFVELASEVLRADKHYQYQLYVILDQVRQVQQPGEAPMDAEWAERERDAEYGGESFAHVGSRRVLD